MNWHENLTGATTRIASPPPDVGYFTLDGGNPSLRLYRPVRPNWLHRSLIRLAFGIRWTDL